jgi:hypothetical protein
VIIYDIPEYYVLSSISVSILVRVVNDDYVLIVVLIVVLIDG